MSSELAELLRQAVSWILCVAALALEVAGQVVEPISLPIGRFPDGTLLRDDGVLWVREHQHRDQQHHGRERGKRRRPREPRREQGGSSPQRLQRVAPLSPDEAVGLGGLVDCRDRGIQVEVVGRRRRRSREADGELHGRRHAIAQAALDVHGQRRLAE